MSSRIKILSSDDSTLWAKAYNDCNKSTFKSGENHVWIRWYKTSKYFTMGLAKDGPPGGGGKSEIILNVNNVDNPEFIQIVGPESKTPKIQIKYNRDGKICTVTLEPCDETKRTTQYKNCLTPVYAFITQKDWVDQVMNWFKYKKLISTKTKTTTPSTPLTDAEADAEVEKMIKEEEQKKQQFHDRSQIVENKQISDLSEQSQQINELSSKTDEEANKHIAEAQKQMEEHNEIMTKQDKIINEALGITSEEKKGGKKSRKKRRTKRRKSIRRKKGKKSKKH